MKRFPAYLSAAACLAMVIAVRGQAVEVPAAREEKVPSPATQPAPPVPQKAQELPLRLNGVNIQVQQGELRIEQRDGIVIITGDGVMQGGEAAAGMRIQIHGGVLMPMPQLTETPVELPILNKGFLGDKEVDSLASVLQAVRSDQFAQREAASRALLQLPPERLAEVTAALKKETDPEAIARLTEAAVHLYLKPRTPLQGRASVLGISMSLETVRRHPEDTDLVATVAVADLKPGFPAAQALRVGDRLIAFEGKLFPVDLSMEGFRAILGKVPGGSVVHFTVIREGKEIDVPVQTGGIGETSATEVSSAINNRDAAMRQFINGLRAPEAASTGSREADGEGLRRLP